MLLFWTLVIPFFTSIICLLAWRSTEMQRGISLVGALALLAVTVTIFTRVVAEGPLAAQAGGWDAPFGITLVADLLSALMVLLVGIVSVLVVCFSFNDITREEEHFGFHPLMHALLAGLCGAFLTGDIFNMYVWFEVILISSFGLLVIGGGRQQFDGAVKYVGLNLIATVAFIAGVGLLYGTTGTVNMADLHGKVMGRETEAVILGSAAFLIFAFGSKAALFPVYFWLPASYHTPSFSISVMFAALLTKVGAYALIRVFTLVYPIHGTVMEPVLLWGAVFTLVFGALGALSQTSVRRVLGYAIITSIGSVILGLAIGTPLALAAAVFYMLQDIVVKANLFMAAGATNRLTGSELFARSGGVWQARTWFAVMFLLPALSLAGIPPFPGFWGKLLLIQASYEAADFFLIFVVLAVGLMTIMAVARIWLAVFWTPHPGGEAAIKARLGASTVVPMLILTGLLIFVGIEAGNFIDMAATIGAQLADPSLYVSAVLGGGK